MRRLRSHKKDHHIVGIGRIRVYDAPSYLDRYTIVYLDDATDTPGRAPAIQALGSAENPRGCSGLVTISSIGPHLGRIIAFETLPDAIKKIVS